jgi:cell wall-associated NlpC family hydrolase
MLSVLAAAVLVTVQPSPQLANAADSVPAPPGTSSSANPSPIVASTTASTTASTSSTHSTEADAVITSAKSHLGAPYLWGAQGPWSFDCSGLVLRSFADVGLVSKLGGWGDRSGYAIYSYFERRGLASRSNGEPGDVVVWGGGAHVGIYLGNGMAISALTSGVRIASIYALTNSFTAFLHTGLSAAGSSSVKELGVVASPRTVAAPRKVAAPHKVAAPKTSTSAAVRFASVGLVLRRGAGTGYGSLGTVSRGSRLTVIGKAVDSSHRAWDRVRTGAGKIGWVAAWLTRA